MKRKLWLIVLALVMALCTVAVACDEETPPPAPPAPAEYSVTLPASLEGGTVTADKTKVTEGETLTLTVTEGNGYALDFVKVNGAAATLTDGKYAFTPTSDVTVTAQFSAVEYAIVYNLDGGTLPDGAPTAYTVKSDTITLPAPERVGSTFDGWFDESYTEAVTEIAKGSTGEVEVFALWTLDEYAITYDLSGAPDGTENTNAATYYTVDDTVTLLPLADGVNDYFVGWVDGEDNPVTTIGGGAMGPVSVKAVYAPYTRRIDGAIDASWANYPKASVTSEGSNGTVTAYQRIVDGGLFIELNIAHTGTVTGNFDASNAGNTFWQDSYVSVFVAGANEDSLVWNNATNRELKSGVHQFIVNVSDYKALWQHAKVTTNAEDTLTVIEAFVPLSEIAGYADGDAYVRTGIGICRFSENTGIQRIIRGKHALSEEQKYYDNAYYVTADGLYDLDPTLNHLTVSKPEDGGSLTLSKNAVSAANPEAVTVTLELNDGWTLESFTVGGEDKMAEIADGTYEFIPTAHKTEIVAFWDTTRYNITYNGVPGGVENANPTDFTLDTNHTLLPLADLENKNFVGWIDENEDPITAITGDLLQARTLTAVYEDSVRRFDGAIDASWVDYADALVYKSGTGAAAGQTVTAYSRIVEDGLFIELKIEHTKAPVKDTAATGSNTWWNDAYIASFIAGADESQWSKRNTTLLSGGAPHQHILTNDALAQLWKFSRITTTGNDTDGYVTVVEMFRDLEGIKGYTAGDAFVRLAIGVAGFNGTANKPVYVSTTNAAQDNFGGMFFVTANGAFVASPTVATAAWADAHKVTKNSVTVYARLTDGGLYTEMLISGTKAAPTVNGANWYNNSYIAPWIAGANYTVPANGKSVQRQITPSLNNLNLAALLTHYKFGATTGNATDGYVTKISMLVPFSAINGYAAGDKYVRMSVCVGEWGSGTVHVGTGGYSSSQNADYYENGYFVTASGMSTTAPATT